MTLGERIDPAREARARGLAPLPIVLSALEIPRATWYYYRKQKVEADRKKSAASRRLPPGHPGTPRKGNSCQPQADPPAAADRAAGGG